MADMIKSKSKGKQETEENNEEGHSELDAMQLGDDKLMANDSEEQLMSKPAEEDSELTYS